MLVFFGLFIWGADLYVRLFQPPPNALKIYVIAKQWMWKIEHHGGQREINALHVPIGQPIQLVMTSEDVIHDFSVPAFRIKHDVLPGRYETLWFQVETAGVYRLFCTQFCGADHAQMTGEVVAMALPEYEQWLEQNGASGSMAKQGGILFMRYGCSGCHGGNGIGGAQATSAVQRLRSRDSMAAPCRSKTARLSPPTKVTSATAFCCRRSDGSRAIRRSCPRSPDKSARRMF